MNHASCARLQVADQDLGYCLALFLTYTFKYFITFIIIVEKLHANTAQQKFDHTFVCMLE